VAIRLSRTLITAYGDAETKRQALENGAEALLTKPIDFGTLALTPILARPAARAQQPALPVIGFLHTLSPENVSNPMAGFHQGLKEAGYSESQNVAIEYRWAEGYDRLPALAAVRRP
jgi:hypothetical protein